MGMAQGALETYIDQIAVRKTRGAALSQPQSMADFPTIQARVAEAAAAIDAATVSCRHAIATTSCASCAEGRPN
jgi:alkylation response protein AidB-like acyl-CoA dehydrogenase